jgi:oligosaccharide repeat unit polymerase
MFLSILLVVLQAIVLFWAIFREKKIIGELDIFSPTFFYMLYFLLNCIFLNMYILSYKYNVKDFLDYPIYETIYYYNLANFYILLYTAIYFFTYLTALKNTKVTYMKASGKKLPLSLSITSFFIFLMIIYLMVGNTSVEMRSQYTEGIQGKILFIIIGFAGILFSYIIARLFSKRAKLNILNYLLLGFLVLSFIYIFYQMGGRGRAISSIVMVAVAYHYLYKTISFIQIFFIVSIMALFIVILPKYEFDIMDALRLFPEALYNKSFGRNFDAVENFVVLLREFDNKDLHFMYGATLVNDILSDIGNIGRFANDTRDFYMKDILGFKEVLAGRPVTKPGEFYINFGPIGIVFVAISLGYLNAKIYSTLILNRAYGISSIPLYIVFLQAGWFQYYGYVFQNLIFLFVKIVTVIIIAVIFFGSYKFIIKRGVN